MNKRNKILVASGMALALATTAAVTTTVMLVQNHKQNEAMIEAKKYDAVYQSGPKDEADKRELSQSNELSYFFGDIEFNYVTYKVEENNISFFGNEENVKRTKIYNNKIKLWKNDVYEEQLILFKNLNENVVKDLKVELVTEDNDIEASIHVLEPIKNKNTTKASNDLIPQGEYYTFDQVSNKNEVADMKFDFQPYVLRFKSGENAKSGKLDFKVTYKINASEKEINITKDFVISNNLSYEDSIFGSSSMFFPNTSSKFILKNLNDVVPVRKIEYLQSDGINFTDLNQLKEIIVEKNPFLPADSIIYNVEKKDGFTRVWLKSETYKYVTSANQQINYINVDFYEKSVETLGADNFNAESIATKIIGNYDYGIVDDITRTLPRYLSDNTDVTRENILGRKIKDMSERSNYESISVPNFGLGNFIKYVFTPTGSENVIDNFMGDTLEEVFTNTNELGKWELDFKVFDKYVDFLKESGVKNILIPIGARGNSNMFNFIVKDNDSRAYQISAKSLFVDGNGLISEDGITIINQMIPLLRDQMAEHASLNSEIYSDINIYYSYDEFSAEVNNLSIDIFNQISDKYKTFWKSHLYGGWEFQLESRDYEGLVNGLDTYDYVTLQQREFVYEFSKSEEKLNDLVKYFEKRESEGKNTHIYSSWNNYPATYLNSNGYEMLWAMLFSKKIGANGYDRYQVDGYKNDISLDGEVLNPSKEPGDSFYIYPGDGENMLDSLRYLNMIKGINLTNKATEIISQNPELEKNGDILSFDMTNENRYIGEKWNLNYFETNDPSTTSLSGQATYINWLIKNYGF